MLVEKMQFLLSCFCCSCRGPAYHHSHVSVLLGTGFPPCSCWREVQHILCGALWCCRCQSATRLLLQGDRLGAEAGHSASRALTNRPHPTGSEHGGQIWGLKQVHWQPPDMESNEQGPGPNRMSHWE